MIQKQYDIEYGDSPGGDYLEEQDEGELLGDSPQKPGSALTVWHWCTIIICASMVIFGIVKNNYLVSSVFILAGYFEIRTALLHHDIQQLQDRIKSLENSQ